MEVIPTYSRSLVLFALDAYWKASRLCKGVDIITTQGTVFSGLAGLGLKYRFKKPLLVQVHGDSLDNPYWLEEKLSHRVLNPVGKFVLRRADGIRVVSEKVKQRVINMGVEEERVFKLPIHTDLRKFAQTVDEGLRERFPGFENIVLFVGRLSREKNLPALLEAASMVVEEHPDTLFLIAGEGPEKPRLENLAEQLELEANVVFEGRVEHDRLPAYYQASDIFVLPSFHEGWGLVLVEALASGTPVVTTDVGLAGEYVTSGREGYVVKSPSPAHIKEKINYLLENPELRKKMGKVAKERAMKSQDLKESARAQRRIYEKVLEGRK